MLDIALNICYQVFLSSSYLLLNNVNNVFFFILTASVHSFVDIILSVTTDEGLIGSFQPKYNMVFELFTENKMFVNLIYSNQCC